MTGLKSYKDFAKEDKFSWADINFSTLFKIIEARANDYLRFQSYITALECALNFFAQKDSEYLGELSLLMQHKKNIESSRNKTREEIDVWYWDEKYKILASLIGRVNQGKIKICQYLDNSYVIKDIAQKLSTGIGQNCYVTGKTGSGKSESTIRMCQKICELNGLKFNHNTHVVFTPSKFAQVYNDVKNTPPGSCIVFDEAGVTYNSRDFYTDQNKIFSKLMQIIRHRSLAIFFNAPDLSYIDTQGRKLLHWWFETVKLNKNIGICEVKPKIVDIQQQSGKILYPHPIYDEKQITKMKIDGLDPKTRKDYQNLSERYKIILAKRTQLQLLMNKPGDEECLDYMMLREDGLLQKEIRSDKMPMSSEKAARMEKEYKRILAKQASDRNF